MWYRAKPSILRFRYIESGCFSGFMSETMAEEVKRIYNVATVLQIEIFNQQDQHLEADKNPKTGRYSANVSGCHI